MAFYMAIIGGVFSIGIVAGILTKIMNPDINARIY